MTAFWDAPNPQHISSRGATLKGNSNNWSADPVDYYRYIKPIFRSDEIIRLAARINGTEPPVTEEKPLHPSERRSMGQIIAALAAMAGIDLSKPYAADETMRAAAAQHGLELPSSTETVVKYLKSAREKS